jgi:hypothetical protein
MVLRVDVDFQHVDKILVDCHFLDFPAADSPPQVLGDEPWLG